MATRTALLGRAFVAQVEVTLATVPAGETWVLKDWRAYNNGSVTGKLNIYGVSADGLQFGYLAAQNVSALFSASQIANAFVLLPGDTIRAIAGASSFYVWISGARLLGVLT